MLPKGKTLAGDVQRGKPKRKNSVGVRLMPVAEQQFSGNAWLWNSNATEHSERLCRFHDGK